jgi:hypothetical protein
MYNIKYVKYKKWPQITPNDHKIYQHFTFKGPPKYAEIWTFCLKISHLATLLDSSFSRHYRVTRC